MRRRRAERRTGRKLLWALVVLAAAGLATVAGATLYLGLVVSRAVEAVAGRVTGVPVEVGTTLVLPWSGEGTISGVRLGAPDGFRGERTLSFPQVRIELDPRSVIDRTGPLHVRRVEVRGVHLSFERNPRGSNVGEILDHVVSVARSERAAPAPATRAIIVDRLCLTGLRVDGLPPTEGDEDGEPEGALVVGDVEVAGFGSGTGGGTVFDLAERIALSLRDQLVEARLDPGTRLEELEERTGVSEAAAAREMGLKIRESLGTGFE